MDSEIYLALLEKNSKQCQFKAMYQGTIQHCLATQLSTNVMTLPQLLLADDLLPPTVIEPVVKKKSF